MAIETLAGQIVTIISIVVGVIAIINFLEKKYGEEKKNAVEIAEIKKDLVAKDVAILVSREMVNAELKHVQGDINSIKENQENMWQLQSKMSGNIQSIMTSLHIKKLD